MQLAGSSIVRPQLGRLQVARIFSTVPPLGLHQQLILSGIHPALQTFPPMRPNHSHRPVTAGACQPIVTGNLLVYLSDTLRAVGL